jgi:hypothetical protein
MFNPFFSSKFNMGLVFFKKIFWLNFEYNHFRYENLRGSSLFLKYISFSGTQKVWNFKLYILTFYKGAYEYFLLKHEQATWPVIDPSNSPFFIHPSGWYFCISQCPTLSLISSQTTNFSSMLDLKLSTFDNQVILLRIRSKSQSFSSLCVSNFQECLKSSIYFFERSGVLDACPLLVR